MKDRAIKFLISIVLAITGIIVLIFCGIGCVVMAVLCVLIPIIALIKPEWVRWDSQVIGLDIKTNKIEF